MKRLAWITDVHLNFLELPEVEVFLRTVSDTAADAVLVCGDVDEAHDVAVRLDALHGVRPAGVLCPRQPQPGRSRVSSHLNLLGHRVDPHSLHSEVAVGDACGNCRSPKNSAKRVSRSSTAFASAGYRFRLASVEAASSAAQSLSSSRSPASRRWRQPAAASPPRPPTVPIRPCAERSNTSASPSQLVGVKPPVDTHDDRHQRMPRPSAETRTARTPRAHSASKPPSRLLLV